MNTRAVRLGVGCFIAILALLSDASVAFAADPPSPGHPALTKEQRQRMATIHERIAACLRSDTPISECHKEAMKSCQETMGKGECPIMGGAMHEHMMQPYSETDVHQ